MHAKDQDTELNEWVLSEMIVQRFPQFSQSTLNYLMRERKRLGLSEAVRVLGRKRYIHVSRFAEWLESDCPRRRHGRGLLG